MSGDSTDEPEYELDVLEFTSRTRAREGLRLASDAGWRTVRFDASNPRRVVALVSRGSGRPTHGAANLCVVDSADADVSD